jgi:hypothetical protein
MALKAVAPAFLIFLIFWGGGRLEKNRPWACPPPLWGLGSGPFFGPFL